MKINCYRFLVTTAAFDNLKTHPELDAELLERIEKWIGEASDSELFRINLNALSSAWKIPLGQAVTHFLHLTKAGVMELSWDIHCPRCNVVLTRDASLQKVTGTHSCPYCLRDVESRLDDHFEVTFSVHPTIRAVKGYVRYEPSANVEILLREKIKPGEDRRIAIAPAPHVRNLRFVVWPPVAVTAVAIEPHSTNFPLTFLGGEEVRFPETCPEGEFALPVENRSPIEMNLMLENHDMAEYEPHQRAPRLRGLDVINVPAFRELFASETLSERESLKVRSVAIVFTDIKGSTELYKSVGDVRAYNLVRDHFEILFEKIALHGGAVVKTIGDSVMASFPGPEDAVQAMLDVQKEFFIRQRIAAPDLREAGGSRPLGPAPLSIRAGIHAGSALVVTLNHRIDYFGTMVNEASRLEGQCLENQLVLSEIVWRQTEHLLKEYRSERADEHLKGLGNYRLFRVSLEGPII